MAVEGPWTVVSAYLSGINAFRTDDEYIALGKDLIEAPVPKVLFIDESLRDRFETTREDTHFVWTRFDDLYFASHEHRLSLTALQTPTPTKDTVRYLMVQCHKPEWVFRAAQMNPFRSTHFLWADIGIRKFFGDGLDLGKALAHATLARPSRIRIPRIWPLDVIASAAALRTHIHWYFAGTVFGGPTAAIEEFADRMRRLCQHAVDQNWLTWEVNLWAMLYREDPELFDAYPANHDRTLLDGFAQDAVSSSRSE